MKTINYNLTAQARDHNCTSWTAQFEGWTPPNGLIIKESTTPQDQLALAELMFKVQPHHLSEGKRRKTIQNAGLSPKGETEALECLATIEQANARLRQIVHQETN